MITTAGVQITTAGVQMREFAGRPAHAAPRCWNGCGYSCVHGEFGDGGVTVRPGGLVPRGRRAVNGAGGGFLELDRRGTGSCPPPSLPPVVT